MNIYHAMIELKQDARALGFAQATAAWMAYLKERGLIEDWRLMRRKFGLAAGPHTDFLLEVRVENFAALDTAFTELGLSDETAERLYLTMHQSIASVDVGLYRPYPDPAQRERIALV